MPMSKALVAPVQQRLQRCAASVGVFVADVGRGMLEISHNTLALLGLVGVAAALFFASHRELRHDIENRAFGWLQARHEARADPAELMAASLSEPDAIARATATDPKELTRQQGAVAQWLSRRYRVAPQPVSRLVQESWKVGQKVGLDPTLILSIMAVESSFNPFAQSAVGAQGLMQVMTGVHVAKYEPFGGNFAAFDPVTNLRVGVLVLKECIARAGGLEAGLRAYVGASASNDDGGYAVKVLAEQTRLKLVAEGKNVPIGTPPAPATPTPVHPKLEAEAPAPEASDADVTPRPDRVAMLGR